VKCCNELYKCAINLINNPNSVDSDSKIVTILFLDQQYASLTFPPSCVVSLYTYMTMSSSGLLMFEYKSVTVSQNLSTSVVSS
jgi:hypothetical protein